MQLGGPAGVVCIRPAFRSPPSITIYPFRVSRVRRPMRLPFRERSQQLSPPCHLRSECHHESVVNTTRTAATLKPSRTHTHSIAAVLQGTKGCLYPLPTTLSAEDEVLVRAAVRKYTTAGTQRKDPIEKIGADSQTSLIATCAGKQSIDLTPDGWSGKSH